MANSVIPRARPQRMEVFYGEDGELYFSLSGKYGQLNARTWRPTSEETRRAIFDLRVKMNWSRAMMAAVLGISTDVLRRWEDGRRNPCASAQKLVWLIHALFLAPTELGNVSNIVSWGNGIKALLVMNEPK